jgi:hypothetical protein
VDNDDRMAAEHHQQELEQQEFIFTKLLHGNATEFEQAWNMMECVKLSKNRQKQLVL